MSTQSFPTFWRDDDGIARTKEDYRQVAHATNISYLNSYFYTEMLRARAEWQLLFGDVARSTQFCPETGRARINIDEDSLHQAHLNAMARMDVEDSVQPTNAPSPELIQEACQVLKEAENAMQHESNDYIFGDESSSANDAVVKGKERLSRWDRFARSAWGDWIGIFVVCLVAIAFEMMWRLK